MVGSGIRYGPIASGMTGTCGDGTIGGGGGTLTSLSSDISTRINLS